MAQIINNPRGKRLQYKYLMALVLCWLSQLLAQTWRRDERPTNQEERERERERERKNGERNGVGGDACWDIISINKASLMVNNIPINYMRPRASSRCSIYFANLTGW